MPNESTTPSLKHYVLRAETGYIHATPFGFNVYAAEFLEAAKQFKTSRPFSPVPYYLLCHSIELSFKCFLLGKGFSKKELMDRKKYGHQLVKLLARARDLGIDQHVALTTQSLGNLIKANEYYAAKGFEYFEISKAVTAYPDLPDLDALTELASGLVNKLRQFALAVA